MEIAEHKKACTACHVVKSLTDFYREAKHADGHRSVCKQCDAQRHQRRTKRLVEAHGRIYRPLKKIREPLTRNNLSEFTSVDASGCWNWILRLNDDGYGKKTLDGKKRSAHVIVWILFNGDLPKGKCVLHKCDNRRCVNPDHLFVGTQLDNIQDMKEKGRARKGVTHFWAKINPAIVANMRSDRASGQTFKSIAEKYGVDEKTAWHAIKGRTWRHVA